MGDFNLPHFDWPALTYPVDGIHDIFAQCVFDNGFVTTCWLLDFHVLTDDRPASSTLVCKAAVRPMRGFVATFLVTKCCRLDASYIRQLIDTEEECNDTKNRT